MQTLSAGCISLVFCVLLTASCLGWGCWLARLIGVRTNVPDSGFRQVWLGWCAVLFLLQLLHCFTPLNIYPSATVYGIGLLFALGAYRPGGVSAFWNDLRSAGRTMQIAFLILTIWVVLQSLTAPGTHVLQSTISGGIYDDGLYHFNAVRWINEYRIVPGLGNLHGRLAFNDSFFAFVASLNFYPRFNHGHDLATAWMFLILTAECLFCVGRVCKAPWRSMNLPVADILPALLVPYLFKTAFDIDFASPQDDVPSFLIRYVVFIYLWRALAVENRLEVVENARLLLIVGITAVTLKLSNLFFAGAACLVVFLRYASVQDQWLRSLWKDLGRAASFAFVVLLLWMGRGVITSGYPIYPSTFMGLHTSWTIPAPKAMAMSYWIYSWARQPFEDYHSVLANWRWVRPWLASIWEIRALAVDVAVPVLLSLPALCVAAVAVFKDSSGHRPLSRYYLGLLPVLVGLIFWFGLAPNPRFAYGLFWLLPLAILCPWVVTGPASRQRKGTLALLGLMCLPFCLSLHGTHGIYKQGFHLPNTRWQPIETVPLTQKVTSHGLNIYVPVQGDQCWDSPLPCTPYFNPSLQLRRKTLQSGFKSL